MADNWINWKEVSATYARMTGLNILPTYNRKIITPDILIPNESYVNPDEINNIYNPIDYLRKFNPLDYLKKPDNKDYRLLTIDYLGNSRVKLYDFKNL